MQGGTFLSWFVSKLSMEMLCSIPMPQGSGGNKACVVSARNEPGRRAGRMCGHRMLGPARSSRGFPDDEINRRMSLLPTPDIWEQLVEGMIYTKGICRFLAQGKVRGRE